MKKTIKIKYVDFWNKFTPENNIHEILTKKYNVKISDKPDYLICSCFGFDNSEHRNYECPKIFYSGENRSTNLNLYDYGMEKKK